MSYIPRFGDASKSLTAVGDVLACPNFGICGTILIFTRVLPLMFQYVLDIELVGHEDNVHFYQYQI